MQTFNGENIETLILKDVNFVNKKNFEEFLNKLDSCHKLTNFGISHLDPEYETMLPILSQKLSANNQFSLKVIDISKNKISKEILLKFLINLKGFVQLERLDLTTLKNIHEFTVDDIIELMKAFEDPS